VSARFLRPCQAALGAHDQDSTIVSKVVPYRKTMTHFDRRCGSLLSQFDSLVHCLVSTDCHIIFMYSANHCSDQDPEGETRGRGCAEHTVGPLSQQTGHNTAVHLCAVRARLR